MLEQIVEFKVPFRRNPVDIQRIKMETCNIGNVSEDLAELKTRVEVKQSCHVVNPDRHVQVEEHFLYYSWLRQNDIHYH